ncbi:asparagine synthase-related protein [Streptomyces sp. NPDC048106]|uniref:asparagine synthase-related protein n=1 Tax=Streptomyces sp. NPDC048106 TaxID=3155750 RepID=UPI003452E0BE
MSDADALASVLPGSFHLVVSAGGQTRFQGSITGLRRVFHSRISGVVVAGDRADVLAAMSGDGIDERMLAVTVACGGHVPPPLGEQPMWSGVSSLPADHALVWDGQRARAMRWWRPPAPDKPLAQGAGEVREALSCALRQRAPAQGRLSADLSGGMDSTSLCFLAARDVPGLLTVRWAEAEAGNDDAVFAQHAIAALRDAEHVVIAQADLPLNFDDPGVLADAEEPYRYARTASRTRHTAAVLARGGCRRHLAGHGGDELFTPLPGYLHRLARQHPLTALSHLRAHAALRRWPLLPTLARLARPGTPADWWQAQADQLTNPPPPPRRPVLGWGMWPLRAPSWVTPQAADLARQALQETAHDARPLADDPGQHQHLLALRSSTAGYRLLARQYQQAGVELDMPYFDDRVAEAVLSVRLHEHAGPLRYKPLLSDAMTGILPDPIRSRTTKGVFSQDSTTGLRRNLGKIMDLFADSVLEQAGLIDTDQLRRRLQQAQRDIRTAIALESLIGCETWLRAARNRPTPAPARRLDDPAPAP